MCFNEDIWNDRLDIITTITLHEIVWQQMLVSFISISKDSTVEKQERKKLMKTAKKGENAQRNEHIWKPSRN